MRIAQVAPLFESVPPRLYGGTERVVSYLTEELVGLGHDVTLFASGDSVTSAQLVPVWDRALRLDTRDPEPTSLHILMVEEVFKRLPTFDIVHFHTGALHLSLARRNVTPCLATMHGRMDLPGFEPLYREFSDLPLISISDAQRLPLPRANWLGTVHHGLPQQLYRAGEGGGGYLVFLGRLSPEKGVCSAIEIARRCDLPLKIAAKVDRADRDYFDTSIRSKIDGRNVEYLGELNDHEKGTLLADARALLFPIDWPEPFGIAMIEALACGTPVVAFRRGSVPEILRHGVSGYIVESVEEAVNGVRLLNRISRTACREEFEQRFTAERMARNYILVYQTLLHTAPGFEDRTATPLSGSGVLQ